MAEIPSLLGPFGNLIAFGVGQATGPLLRPPIQDLINEAWTLHPVRPPAATLLASGVAQGQVDETWARARAAETGISGDTFGRLVDIANVGPGSAFAFELWRRGVIGEPGFRRAVRRLGLEDEWIDDLVQLKQVLLTPGELAQARQRGFIDQARQYDEAALQGVDAERAEVQFKSAGLPPPTERALQMWRRGIITETEFKQTIVEGNEKLKYQDEEAALFRPLLTPATIVNQRLRGWRDTAWMNARLAEHGFDTEQANDLFEGQGRPISFRQVFIGERRGGSYGAGNAGIAPAFLKSLEESNIRPEWYQLAWAQRHTYPSAFVLRALVQSGDLSADEGYDILLRIGWPETLARTVADRWGGGTATATDPAVRSVKTAALTRIRDAYVQNRADQGQVEGWLGQLGYDAATTAELVGVYDVLKTIPGGGLTRAQLKKAFKELPTQWPRDRTLAELEALGMEPEEAQTYLDE